MLIGNRVQIRAFNETVLLTPFKICICGPSGSGKTTLARSILKKFNVLENPSDNFQDFIQANKNTLIFIDDIDIGYTKTQLTKIANQKTNVLFTCNQLEKRLVPKNMQMIKLDYPRVNETFPYLLEKLENVNAELLLEKTKLYRGNIREILLNMNFKDGHCSKFKSMNEFEIAKQLLIAPRTSDENVEKNEFIPFLMYENFGQIYGDKNFELYEKLNDNFVASFKIPFGNDIRLRCFLNAKTQPNTDYAKFRFPELFYLK